MSRHALRDMGRAASAESRVSFGTLDGTWPPECARPIPIHPHKKFVFSKLICIIAVIGGMYEHRDYY